MATIAENLQTIKNSIKAIKQAINTKGGTVSGNISTYANAIKNFKIRKYNFEFSTNDDISIGTSSLKQLEMYDGIKQVADLSALPLEQVYFSSTVEGMVSGAFQGCTTLTKVFNLEQTKITELKSNTFYNCDKLDQVGLPSTLTKIGSDAFYNCLSLVTLSIPNSVKTIGLNAFYKCQSLQNVYFGKDSQLTSIDDGAFEQCWSLQSITIPEKVTFIGNGAFYGCSALKSITCNASRPPEIGGSQTFHMADEITVYVPYYAVLDYQSSPYWGECNIKAL